MSGKENPEKPIDVFVIFYGEKSFAPLVLTLLRECLDTIDKFSDYPHQAYVVDNGSEEEVVDEIRGWGWPVIVNENPRGYSTVMNKCITSAKSDPFVSLHGDMKATEGWLRTLVEEHWYCEEYFQRPSCLIPKFLRYEVHKDSIVWKECKTSDVETTETMPEYCRKNKIPYHPRVGIYCRPSYKGKIERSATPITDDGAHLMSFIASQAFFKEVGLYDEGYEGYGYEDCDIGIRALKKGLKVLQTHGVYIPHVIAVSRGRGKDGNTGRTWDYFKEKWGEEVWDNLESGRIWIQLHNEQER